MSAQASNSQDSRIDALVHGVDFKWSDTVGNGAGYAGMSARVTYSFFRDAPEDTPGFLEFNAAQKAAARQALLEWGAPANIEFAQTDAGTGDIRFLFADLPADTGGVGTPPNFGSTAGIVKINNSYTDLTAGTLDYQILLHEVGHALGMKHPGEAGGEPPYLPSGEDTITNTVMSYNYTSFTLADEIGSFDETAIKYLYGVRGGAENETYRDLRYLSSSADAFQGTDAQNFIYSNGGDDTLTLGGGNDLGVGGSGADTILGGDGADFLYGNRGNDSIDGGSGNDVIFGGQNGGTTMTANETGVFAYRQGVDTIHGGDGTDIIYGNFGDDEISGGSGDDLIYGGQDSDTIHGGTGVDTMYGNLGDDLFHTSRGNKIIDGGAGEDTVTFDGGIAQYLLLCGNDGESLVVKDQTTLDTYFLSNVETLEFQGRPYSHEEFCGHGNRNLGFEDYLEGWSTIGLVSDISIDLSEGNYSTRILSRGATDSEIEAAIGMGAGALDAAIGQDALAGAALWRTISTPDQTTLTFDWRFASYSIWPSYAFYSIDGETPTILATSSNVGESGYTNWATASISLTPAENHVIAVGVYNTIDWSGSAAALTVDNFQIF